MAHNSRAASPVGSPVAFACSQLLEDGRLQGLGVVPLRLGHAGHALVGRVHGRISVTSAYLGAVVLFVLGNGPGLHAFESFLIGHSASSFQGRDGLLHRSHQSFQFFLPRAQRGKVVGEHRTEVETVISEGVANGAEKSPQDRSSRICCSRSTSAAP